MRSASNRRYSEWYRTYLYISGNLDLVAGCNDDKREGGSGLTLAGTEDGDDNGVKTSQRDKAMRSLVDQLIQLTRSGCKCTGGDSRII